MTHSIFAGSELFAVQAMASRAAAPESVYAGGAPGGKIAMSELLRPIAKHEHSMTLVILNVISSTGEK